MVSYRYNNREHNPILQDIVQISALAQKVFFNRKY